jgi:hypothetical protein
MMGCVSRAGKGVAASVFGALLPASERGALTKFCRRTNSSGNDFARNLGPTDVAQLFESGFESLTHAQSSQVRMLQILSELDSINERIGTAATP